MAKWYRYYTLMCVVALIPACWKVNDTKKDGLVVINVLDEEFYKDCHIKGSLNIPFEKVEQVAIDTIDKSAEVVLYCSNYQCTSSEYAAKKLYEKGFTNVSVYEAGVAEWYQQGYPVEGSTAKAYLKKVCRQMPPDEQSCIPVVSTQQLAKKMNVSSKHQNMAA